MMMTVGEEKRLTLLLYAVSSYCKYEIAKMTIITSITPTKLTYLVSLSRRVGVPVVL